MFCPQEKILVYYFENVNTYSRREKDSFFNVSSDKSCVEKYSAENNNANSNLFIEIRIVRVSKI